MRYPTHYWVSCNFYKALFAGVLGFDLVRVVTNYPSLFGYEFRDDFAEESFQTYDHPKILIFKKSFKNSLILLICYSKYSKNFLHYHSLSFPMEVD